MFVTYTPDGSGPQKWEFKPGKIRATRSSFLEKVFSKLSGEKQTYEQFKAAVQQGSSPARRTLLWHLMSLDHPNLAVDDVDFEEDELVVEFSRDELEGIYAAIKSAKMPDESQREMMLGAIEAQMETAPDDGGKAQLTTSESTTG